MKTDVIELEDTERKQKKMKTDVIELGGSTTEEESDDDEVVVVRDSRIELQNALEIDTLLWMW